MLPISNIHTLMKWVKIGVEEGITQAFFVNDDTGEKIKINMLKIDKMEELLNFLGIEFTESTIEN